MHSSGDTNCHLSCFSLWVGLVFGVHSSLIQTVACLVAECELSWLSMCTLLVTETVACLDSDCELA